MAHWPRAGRIADVARASARSTLLGLAIAASALGCTVVEGDRIHGAELAAANASFSGIDPAVDLGPAPLAGSRRVFRGSELRRLGLAEAPEVCFERASQALTAETLLPVLQAVLEGVEILDFSKYVVPRGKLEFARAGLSASGFWRGRVVYGENRSVAVWAKVRVADSGWVERGDTVRVEVSSGGVLLAFDAAAEGSARTGEPVTVRNPENGRRFRTIVEAKGKVSIKK